MLLSFVVFRHLGGATFFPCTVACRTKDTADFTCLKVLEHIEVVDLRWRGDVHETLVLHAFNQKECDGGLLDLLLGIKLQAVLINLIPNRNALLVLFKICQADHCTVLTSLRSELHTVARRCFGGCVP